MQKLYALAAPLVIISSAACSSMSLEDYAEECGEWSDVYDSLALGSSSLPAMEDAREDWNALNPPGEVKAFHDLRTESLRLGLEFAGGRDDIRDRLYDRSDALVDLWNRLNDLGDEYEDELDDLPRIVERELEAGGCI